MKECKLCYEKFEKLNKRGLCKECAIFSDEEVLKNELLRKINDIKLDLDNVQSQFLRKFGWDCSCSFPDCCWRWVKEIKGETIAVSLNDAISIEKNIMHYQNNNK
jgi:hypothetical protein